MLVGTRSDDGIERDVYYISRLLVDVECRYTTIEKLCLSLYFACTKLEYYLLPKEVFVVCKVNLIKDLLSRSALKGRLIKWDLKLTAYLLNYLPLKAAKGQALADFVAPHPCLDPLYSFNTQTTYIGIKSWIMTFDGSKTQSVIGVGLVLTSLDE